MKTEFYDAGNILETWIAVKLSGEDFSELWISNLREENISDYKLIQLSQVVAKYHLLWTTMSCEALIWHAIRYHHMSTSMSS